MRHNEEWYTCDRCERRIDEVPERAKCFQIFRPAQKFDLTVETVDVNGYVSEHHLVSSQVLSAKIVEYYNSKTKTLHLCSECRKDFERFMRNEKKMDVHT